MICTRVNLLQFLRIRLASLSSNCTRVSLPLAKSCAGCRAYNEPLFIFQMLHKPILDIAKSVFRNAVSQLSINYMVLHL